MIKIIEVKAKTKKEAETKALKKYVTIEKMTSKKNTFMVAFKFK